MDDYKVGDMLFFALPSTTAGEAMYVGRLKASEDLVVVIGAQMTEIPCEHCSPIRPRRGFPAEAASWRQGYLKQHPGSLLP